MNIFPMWNYVLIAEEEAKKKTSSVGIIIEGDDKDSKPCKVLGVGPNCTTVTEGDRVFVDWSKGKILTIDGAQRVIVPEDAVVAVIG